MICGGKCGYGVVGEMGGNLGVHGEEEARGGQYDRPMSLAG